MKIPRRRFLHLAAGAAAFPAVSRIASAQTYPTRLVRIVVGFPPGSASDIAARLMGRSSSRIDPAPGAILRLRRRYVRYTLLLVGSNDAINATLYRKLSFNLIRDIAPVAGIVRVPQVMVVNASFPIKTVPEFIAYAKANPGKISFASGGIGSTPHVTGELFKVMAGVDMLHVPYRGLPPALTDLLGGQVQVIFAVTAPSIEYIRAGKLRALAVTTATRSEALPEVPTLGDFVPGFEATGWQGVAAPKNTRTEIIDRLNREINAALADPTMKARLADLGGTVLTGSPADFGKFIDAETEKWGKVIRAANIKAQ
jgi:tripartite-type tricarboxylate transporter receptor subunit TctC